MNGTFRLWLAALRRAAPQCSTASDPAPAPDPAPVERPGRLVVVTACPTGIARTYMAAEALQQAGLIFGHELRIETQGSVGSGNPLTPEEIADADVVLLAVDREVDRSRFAGKRVFVSPTNPAIVDPQDLIRRALAEAEVQKPRARVRREEATPRSGPYRHLMTGVSFMLPFAAAGGFLTAMAFALLGPDSDAEGLRRTLGLALRQIGMDGGFALMLPALAGYLSFSIADRPGIAPGMIGGMVCNLLGAGFLGGIAAGFVAGYGTRTLNRHIVLPRTLAGLKPVLVLPLLGTLLTGLVMIFLVGKPAAWLNEALSVRLNGLQGMSSVGLGLLLGVMMALDLGGPLNKAAFAFAVGMLETDVCRPMAAVTAAGMTPPLAAFLCTRLFAARFSREEREAGDAALLMGLAFVSEGAIPFAARDPLRAIPAFAAGSALAGAMTMAFGVRVMVPHGGVFALPLPGAVHNVPGLLAAVLAGTVLSALLMGLLKATRSTDETTGRSK